MLKEKSDAFEMFKNFKALLENGTKKIVKKYYGLDGGRILLERIYIVL